MIVEELVDVGAREVEVRWNPLCRIERGDTPIRAPPVAIPQIFPLFVEVLEGETVVME